jgi:signal peptidase I
VKGYRVSKYVRAAAIVAALVPAWFFLAPPQLGGSTSYVVITGNSMEPLLHSDDLVLVRDDAYYEVGDVAAYQSEELHRLVLHRIVEREEGSFVFQGDNNDFLDPERPGDDEVQGALWATIPNAGIAIRFMQGPIGIAIAAVVIMALLGVFSVKRRRKRTGRHSVKRKGEPAPAARPRRSPPPPPPPRSASEIRSMPAPTLLQEPAGDEPTFGTRRRVVQMVASVAAVATIFFVVVGAVASTRPANVPVADELFFEHSGTFSYAATAPGSAAYDGPKVTTGEPVFLRLVDDASFTFDYTFESELPHDVTSRGSMTARLGAENGLSRTLELSGGTSAGDESLNVSATMSLHELRTIVREIERETGVEQGIYTVTLSPQVELSGTLGAEPLETSFTPSLQLEFDSLQLRTIRDGSDDAADPFAPEATDSIDVVGERTNQIFVLDRAVAVETIEKASLYGGSGTASILLIALILLVATRPEDEPARIAAKYGGALIAVSETPTHVDAVEVTDFRTLVRLAQQFEAAVLHERSAGGHVYMVPHDGILYRYRSGARTVPDAAPPTVYIPSRKAQ